MTNELAENDHTLRTWQALVLLVGLWALIFLPYLGHGEFKGEEGRRVLPGVEMLQHGRWMLPRMGGEDYLSKPPGINWIVAASFILTGQQNEWSARLPSALAVLALGVMIVCQLRFLPLPTRLAAAVIFATNIGMMEKGRLIEIEAIYTCATGMAIVWWLSAWTEGRSSPRVWVLPCLILAAGSLVKGPFLAGPFYAVAVAVLIQQRRLRALLSPGHLIGVGLIMVICLGWVFLAKSETTAAAMQSGWSGQLAGRFSFESASAKVWIVNVLRSPLYLMPWLLFLPLVWVKRFTGRIDPERQGLFRALRWALVASFVMFNAMPGVWPRYAMPVLPLASLLVGWVLVPAQWEAPLASDRVWQAGLRIVLGLIALAAVGCLVWQRTWAMALVAVAVGAVAAAVLWGLLWRGEKQRWQLVAVTGLCCGLGMCMYAAASAPYMLKNQWRRPAAQAVNDALPPGQIVYVYRPGYQIFLFYVRQPLAYAVTPEAVDESVRYLLVDQDQLAQGELAARLKQRGYVELAKAHREDKSAFVLLELSAAAPAGATASATHPAAATTHASGR